MRINRVAARKKAEHGKAVLIEVDGEKIVEIDHADLSTHNTVAKLQAEAARQAGQAGQRLPAIFFHVNRDGSVAVATGAEPRVWPEGDGAQPCDHHVYPGVAVEVYGDELLEGRPIEPGDRVCIHAGTYEGRLYLLNLVGEEQNPITIVNVDGQVVVEGTLRIISSRHVVLDGSGAEDVTYGFKVVDPEWEGLRIWQGETVPGSQGYEVSDIEVHHVEILFDTTHGTIGVSAGNSIGSNVLEELTLHDMYIHRTKRSPVEDSGTYTEGFYIGSSHYNSEDVAILRGVRIYNNRVEESGWDGIQVGSASGGCEIFNNTVIKDSREYIHYQHSGIIVNHGSKCDVYNNDIIDSHGAGIYYQGIGAHVFNNLIVLAEQIENEPLTQEHQEDPSINPVPEGHETRRGITMATTIDTKNENQKGDLFVYNNTIIGAKPFAISKNDGNIGYYEIFNNLIINSENSISGVQDPSKVFDNEVISCMLDLPDDLDSDSLEEWIHECRES